jgi:hypothetical protein
MALLRAHSAIGMAGKMFVPHLLRELRATSAASDPGSPDYVPARPAQTFDHPEPKVLRFLPIRAPW